MNVLKLRVRFGLLAVLCLVASLLFGSPALAAEDQATCGGQPVTIYGAVQLAQNPQPSPMPDHYNGPVIMGTEGDDVILGTNGAEWILGLGGNDVICGLAGEDYITGGGGVDRIRGGAGPDHISGSGLTEILRGGAGHDEIAVDTYNGVPYQNVDLGQGGGVLVPRFTVVCHEPVAGDDGLLIPQCSAIGSGQWWF